jgi:UDP-N-acetylglucosamine 3-dehydrogenase
MINVAVIGLGNMGQHHAKAYSMLSESTLVAVCDPNRDRFDHIIKSADTVYVPTVDDLLAIPNLHAVSVCVPTRYHFDVSKQCLDAGLAVLVEKPIAETVQQAKDLVNYAKTKDVLLTVGHIERFNPAIVRLKDWVDAGNLGTLQTILCKRYGPFPKQIKDANVLVDVAVHDIDIVQYLVGKAPIKSSVTTKRIHCRDRADYGHLMLSYEDGLYVDIYASWAFPYKERTIELVGDKGVALVDCIAQTVQVYDVVPEKSADAVSLPLSAPRSLTIHKHEPIIEECRAFILAYQHQQPPRICPEQATDALALALTSS